MRYEYRVCADVGESAMITVYCKAGPHGQDVELYMTMIEAEALARSLQQATLAVRAGHPYPQRRDGR